ncbi:MAG: M15 family metallopeptidase [Patescibacteria group bacterium]
MSECERQGIEVLITCTYRSNAEQADTYAQGRTQPGRVVTWAKPGESLHNVIGPDGKPSSKAFDFVVLRNGKIIWGTSGDGIDDDPSDDNTDDLELWQRAGSIGESLSLTWAGRWPKPKTEFPHLQLKDV